MIRFLSGVLFQQKPSIKKNCVVKIVNPTPNQLDKILLNQKNKLIAFTTNWSIESQKMKEQRELERIAQSFHDLAVYEVDVTSSPLIVKSQNISTFPDVRFLKKNLQVYRPANATLFDVLKAYIKN